MKLLRIGGAEKIKFEICFVNLTILFYLFRTSIPIFKYPFLLLYVSLLVYCAIIYKKRIIPTLAEFFRNYYLLFILGLIIVISFLLSNKFYLTIFKDVVNMIVLLSIFFMSTLIVRGKNELNYYILNLVYLIVLFSFFISILTLLDYFDIYSYIDYSKDVVVSGSNSRDTIALDYNFALLPVFFGIISILYFLLKTNSKLKKICFNILLLIFSFDIILSGSRRGLITFMAILFALMIAQVYAFYKKDSLIGKLGYNSKYFLLSIFFLSILSLYITLKADYSFKVKLLEFIGCKNISDTKVKIAIKVFKYSSIIGKKYSFQEFYSTIWPTIPEDPDSGWGTRVHKTIFPLTGKNVGIVPNHVKGYLMDSTCNASYYSGIDLSESYTLAADFKVRNGDKYKATVYCFVSDKYDGDVVYFGVLSAIIINRIVSGRVSTLYDLNNKGIWQKLEIDIVCSDGEVPVLMSFWKKGVKDFSKLKGYVIFAYPTYEKINKTDNILPSRNIKSKEEYTPFVTPDLAINASYHTDNKPLTFSKKKSEIKKPDIMSSNKLSNRTKMSIIESSSSIQKYFSAGIFCLPLSVFFVSGSIQNHQDPVRKLASKFISEDSTYHPYKANIVLDTISNSFIGDRVSRWEFALKIFSKEFDWNQKLFGGGFNFLNWYGYYFDKDKTRSDYPHNPFLSVLLYSGIVGLIVYIIFMFKVFYYYVKYFKEYKILAVFFIITFFFSFFSAGSPFDPPIMGFFVILPFFIHSIHKKKEPELDDDHINQEIGSIS